MMNGAKERGSIWVGVVREVDDIPWLVETYKNEAVGHSNSAVFVGPAISFMECSKLEKIFDFVVTMAEDENPVACSFSLWDHVSFRFAPNGENSTTIPLLENKPAAIKSENEPIAIIGMACRLPGSNDYNTFWNNLVNGVDSIGEAPKDRFLPARGSTKLTPEHLSTKAGYLSCPVDTFDAKFWGMSPMELDYTDPQARMVLQLGWEALEDAGIRPSTIHGTDAAVYLGFWREDYSDLLVQSGVSAGNELRRYLGCSMGNAAARVAHTFGTIGPALSTETGCSSTICSIGAAMAALRNNKTGLALVGGANLILKPFIYKDFQGVLSPSGRCKVFQSNADGFVRSEGVIMYILKRLTDAKRDGNQIYAILSGYGTSQEGLTRSTGTPTIDGEARAITLALKDAGVSPFDIDWLEMHGTGTKVGDPIEVAATRLAYELNIEESEREKPLIITSVKANIGHTESVSGAAGLLKVMLAIKHGAIPPQRLTSAINPKLNLKGFHIPLELTPWKGKYAGVSSFGITGTNSHLIVERFSMPKHTGSSESNGIRSFILPLSAKCPSSMTALRKRHAYALQNLDDSQLADYCYTSAICRDHFKEYRHAVVGRNRKDLIQAILSDDFEEEQTTQKTHTKPKVCFLFPGQGCQYPGMGRGLYENCSLFRHHLDLIAGILTKNYGLDIKALIFQGTDTTIYSQLCIFAVEYCILKVWCTWGILPSIVLGHSFGEFAASVTAGAMSLPFALELLVTSRTRVFQNLEEGGMLVLKADETITTNLINNFINEEAEQDTWIDIAAVNSSEQTVISSTQETISRFSSFSDKLGIKNTILNVSYAFHSRALEPVLDQFQCGAAQFKYPLRFKTVDYISSVYGRLIEWKETLDSNYWRKHLRQRVEFIGGAKAALKSEAETIFLEVGPHPILCPLVSSVAASSTETLNGKLLLLPSLRKGADDIITMLDTASSLYINGFDLDWSEIWASLALSPLHQIPSLVPLYPFTTDEAFWFTTSPADEPSSFINEEIHPLLGTYFPTMVVNSYTFINTTSRLLNNPITGEWLRDHKLGMHIIFPAAAYAEMTFAAVDAIKRINNKNLRTSRFGVELSNFRIQAALSMGTNAEFYTLVQVNEESAIYNISFLSRKPSSGMHGAHTMHASTVAQVISPDVDASNGKDQDMGNISTCDIKNGKEIGDLYDQMQAVGYNFGNKFKILNNIVCETETTSITCNLNIADDLLKPGGYFIHPVIIDSLIQSSLLIGNNQINRLRLPVAIQSLGLHKLPQTIDKTSLKIVGSGKGVRLFVKTTHPEIHSRESLWTEVAKISGLTTVSTSIKLLEKSLAPHITKSLPIYAEEWRRLEKPKERPIDDAFSSTVILPKPFELSHDERIEVQRLENFCLNRIASTFHKLGWPWGVGSKLHAQDVIIELGLGRLNPNFFMQLMHHIEQAGYIKQFEPCKWQVVRDFKGIQDVDPGINHCMVEEWKFANFYCAKLGSFLLGKESVLPYLFPAAASIQIDYSADKLYKNFTTNIGLLKNLNSMFLTLLKNQYKNGCHLNILEVGAGTGSATKNLIPLLEDYTVSYTFTDISPSFLSAAKNSMPKIQGIAFKYCTFDVQKDATSQGFLKGNYDIIIAFSVLHATQDVQEVCSNLKGLLTVGGHLLIGEQFRPSPIVDIVFGHCKDYWKFQDAHRIAHCLLGLEGWINVLACVGFKSTKFLESKDLGMGVILATNNINEHPSTQSSNWLMIAEEKSLIADRLENALSEKGTRISYNFVPSDILTNTDLFIFCAPASTDNLNEDHLRKHFPLLGSFLKLAQELIIKKSNCRLLVITHDEASIIDEESIISVGSPLLAFSRNLATEAINVRVTCLDLQDSEVIDIRIAQIMGELEKPLTKWKQEPIISYREGQKYTAKLIRLQIPKVSNISNKNNFHQLQLPTSRSIQDLVWEERPMTGLKLDPNQIKIHIQASGLNFKDILNIMKPTAEFHNSHGVGADFSGIIVAIGNSVSKWKIGDSVIGMNPKSEPLPNYVTLNADLLAKLPENFTHSEGASLPTAFVTAYHCLVSVGKLQAGETVLIHTASGGVGLAAIQIAKSVGANLIVTAGSNRKRAYLRALGLTHIYNSRDTSFAKAVLDITAGHGVDIVLNSLTSKGWKEASLSATKNGGRFIEMSKLNIWSVGEVYERRPDVQYSIEDLGVPDTSRAINLIHQLNHWIENNTLSPLRVNIFSAEYITAALTELQAAKHIGKVVINRTGQIFNTRSTYLITGGLGGVGLEIAKWMLSSGAKHLVLVSRRGEESTTETIIKLKEHKVDVSCVIIKSVDVGDNNKVNQLMSEISSTMPPLRGIIHAAGVLSDGTLLQQNISKIETVYNGKVSGAWALHFATRHLNLEHFVVFSSAVSLLGGMGQGNYAAANAAVAALTTYRHRLGLPATCIAWGQWEDLGMTANLNRDVFGVQPFSISAGLEALQTIMESNLGGTVVPNLLSEDVRTSWFPNYIELDQVEEISSIKTAVGEVNLSLKDMTLEDQVVAVISKILRARGSIPNQVDLRDLGMDSLMIIELKNQLSSSFGFQEEIPENSSTEDIIRLVRKAQI